MKLVKSKAYDMHNKKHNQPHFVIQEHQARQHHYDLGLEIDGKLIMWLIPKGLSNVINEKHLAIRTRNKPLSFLNFEGIIPEDEYGAGKVKTYDKGSYEPHMKENTMKQGLAEGAIKFHLHGKKYKGNYALALMGEPNGQEKWLIYKTKDQK